MSILRIAICTTVIFGRAVVHPVIRVRRPSGNGWILLKLQVLRLSYLTAASPRPQLAPDYGLQAPALTIRRATNSWLFSPRSTETFWLRPTKALDCKSWGDMAIPGVLRRNMRSSLLGTMQVIFFMKRRTLFCSPDHHR